MTKLTLKVPFGSLSGNKSKYRQLQVDIQAAPPVADRYLIYIYMASADGRAFGNPSNTDEIHVGYNFQAFLDTTLSGFKDLPPTRVLTDDPIQDDETLPGYEGEDDDPGDGGFGVLSELPLDNDEEAIPNPEDVPS